MTVRALLLCYCLHPAGVTPEDILADYELSPDPERDELLARQQTSVRDILLSVLAGLNIDSYLGSGGATVTRAPDSAMAMAMFF